MLSVVTGLAFECRFCSLLFFLEVFFVRLRLDIFPVTVPPLRLEGRRENKEDPEAFIEAPEHDIEDKNKLKILTEMPVSIRRFFEPIGKQLFGKQVIIGSYVGIFFFFLFNFVDLA